MLRTIRIISAILFFALTTFLFLDFTGSIHLWLGWMAKIQLMPALLAINVGVVALLLLLTLAFGRIYCSVICPLGVFQDIVSWVAGKRKKNRFKYSLPLNWLRYLMMVLFIVSLFAGFSTLVSILEPYSAYGRMVSSLLAPIYQWGNNLFAYLAERADSYLFYDVEVWLKSVTVLVVSATTLIVTGVLAWRNGRSYCNTICPIGTFLGLFSRFSLYKPRFKYDKCNNCGLCARNCKSSCIDAKEHKIDYSRCVACMDCIEKCSQDAIVFAPAFKCKQSKSTPTVTSEKPDDNYDSTRRRFLSLTAIVAVTSLAKSQEKRGDGGLALLVDKKASKRSTFISPPGSHSGDHLIKHCTACQLCVSACPNQVLHSSTRWMTLMHPEMSFERGYCRPECVKCSEVCPTSSIQPITVADKSATQIGHAVWVKERCVVISKDTSCGNCARHCPVGAIQMVASDLARKDSLTIPVVNTERCIGCGACEHLCPSNPYSAIYLEGHERHRTV